MRESLMKYTNIFAALSIIEFIILIAIDGTTFLRVKVASSFCLWFGLVYIINFIQGNSLVFGRGKGKSYENTPENYWPRVWILILWIGFFLIGIGSLYLLFFNRELLSK